MPSPVSSRPRLNLEQQRKLAKELIRSARAGDARAIERLRAVRPDADASSPFRLADAQFALAREAGFESWPKLVASFEQRDVREFVEAIRRADESEVERLVSLSHVRKRVNDPHFDFGQRAIHVAAKNARMLEALIAAGADVNGLSDWSNGPYRALDHADEATARLLIARGAALTPNVAARLGWFDELRAFVTGDPGSVHTRGGDGCQPLHEARTPAIADFLLDHGAGIDVPCVDHHSTPAQYALAERPDVCRRLLERGARPDIYMAARLGDLALAERLVRDDPACVEARINAPGYAPVPKFHIYCWSIGFGTTPQELAARSGHAAVATLLASRSPVRLRFLNAVTSGDTRTADALLAEEPSLVASMPREDHSQLAFAIFHERFDVAARMLDYGFDPSAPGMDGGSALHCACWVGNAKLVERIVGLGAVPLETRDPTHDSTPLGWASFGSVYRRARGADYPAVAEHLVAAGADPHAVGNKNRASLVAMAEGNPMMQDALRRLGAE